MTFRMGPIYIIQGKHGPDLMRIRLNDAATLCFIHGDTLRDASAQRRMLAGFCNNSGDGGKNAVKRKVIISNKLSLSLLNYLTVWRQVLTEHNLFWRCRGELTAHGGSGPQREDHSALRSSDGKLKCWEETPNFSWIRPKMLFHETCLPAARSLYL